MELIVVFLIIILLIAFVSIYNKMVYLSTKVDEGYSSIDVALKKRYDLITNLTEVVKGYAKYESTLIRTIARERSLTRRNELMDNEERKIFSIAEDCPDLKANEQYKYLMSAMVDCEEHLQAARRFYNSNVRAYNVCIQQFPYSIVANSKGFTEKEFFMFDEN